MRVTDQKLIERLAKAEEISPESYWWCPKCMCEVHPMMVRYNETHDREGCGAVCILESVVYDDNRIGDMLRELKREQWFRYFHGLMDILVHDGVCPAGYYEHSVIATPDQKAEALLKVLERSEG